jgi:hypothetical protein
MRLPCNCITPEDGATLSVPLLDTIVTPGKLMLVIDPDSSLPVDDSSHSAPPLASTDKPLVLFVITRLPCSCTTPDDGVMLNVPLLVVNANPGTTTLVIDNDCSKPALDSRASAPLAAFTASPCVLFPVRSAAVSTIAPLCGAMFSVPELVQRRVSGRTISRIVVEAS